MLSLPFFSAHVMPYPMRRLLKLITLQCNYAHQWKENVFSTKKSHAIKNHLAKYRLAYTYFDTFHVDADYINGIYTEQLFCPLQKKKEKESHLQVNRCMQKVNIIRGRGHPSCPFLSST